MFAESDEPTSDLVAIDSRSLQIEWRMKFATIDQQALGDSLRITLGDEIMAVTPDGAHLLLNATEAGGYSLEEPSRLLVIDRNTEAQVRAIPLPGSSPGSSWSVRHNCAPQQSVDRAGFATAEKHAVPPGSLPITPG